MPLSGKTTRAKELKKYLENHLIQSQSRKKVHLINEEVLGIDKKAAYKDSNSEKKARGALISAVERFLSKEDIVICDSLNYIKGFRYQLYCVARGIGTPVCTLFCGSDFLNAKEKNTSIDIYDSTELENICSRFEEPDSRNRWDFPLFILIKTDGSLENSQNPMSQQILNSTIYKKAPPPNLSTVTKPLLETNYLHEVDKITTEILNILIQAQNEGRIGEIFVPKTSLKVLLHSNITLSELRRLKRQYLQITKNYSSSDLSNVAASFVEYLNSSFG